MRAATIRDGEIIAAEHPDPEPVGSEILVRVRAAGINGADMLQLRGAYPAPPGYAPDIPGLEFAGEVIANGPDATRFKIGDSVMAITGGGGQAQLATVDESVAMALPSTLDWSQAGGVAEVFTTAHDALFTQARLVAGERLLVHGGAGGVGSAAVQLGHALGAHVTATVRNPDLRDQVGGLGCDLVLDPQEFVEHGPYDVVLELVGAPNLADDLKALEIGGRICVIGVGGGFTAELNLLALMGKRATIHGSTLRARPLDQKAATARAMEADVLGLFESGAITVPVAATFVLDDVAAAYERFSAGNKFGKIVLITD
ncbi:MAG: zinc-binding dehydrogenase [Solirubrobacterales bacterium]|nr:zinc-binding dehydrogenase [Solirubrobacterales bacterium]